MDILFIDPLIGILITISILKIVLDSSKLVFTRLLDGVEPEIIDKVKNIAESVEGVCEVTDLRVRWIGHQLHAEINASVASSLSVEEGHKIANSIREKLLELLLSFRHHYPCGPSYSLRRTLPLRIWESGYYKGNKSRF